MVTNYLVSTRTFNALFQNSFLQSVAQSVQNDYFDWKELTQKSHSFPSCILSAVSKQSMHD